MHATGAIFRRLRTYRTTDNTSKATLALSFLNVKYFKL